MVPIGTIVLWGKIGVPIPDGWQLCNGTNGTPDLFGRFVKQFSVGNPTGTIGGSESHQHTFDGDGHNHGINTTHDCPDGGSVEAWSSAADGNVVQESDAQGTTDQTDGQPPFMVLAYIMRIS